MDNVPLEYTAKTSPIDVLERLVGAFASRGWLNQTVRLKFRDRRYRISCSANQFIAYRINDNGAMSQGIPGWAVCLVDQEQIIEDSGMSAFASTEPSVLDWLRCIASGDFEVI